MAQGALGAGDNPTLSASRDLPHRAGRGIRGLRQLGRLLHPPLLPRRAAGDGPDDDSVIANACESAPLQVVTGVRRQDAFWLKGQPYSLDNLLDFDPRAAAFEGAPSIRPSSAPSAITAGTAR